ncbi:very-long-chain aldehyde decarbonylase CER1-like [Trifolium pratense]|uniref:very-long-chain aldehyde decarbonylase CER1-like n=1 Tax=Trifolium pratense TaxID=57577 RepID=UPI001E6900EE|nr:very-long-chain aldehyde decarbonylase CER1-like [Trifolium pratense]
MHMLYDIIDHHKFIYNMASKPGILTNWPWKPLGSFKFMILSPWIAHSIYSFIWVERDPVYYLIFPFILVRMLHNQIWISISRYQTAKGKGKIVDKDLNFQQVDREINWDDQILFTALLYYIGYTIFPIAANLPWWRIDGVILTTILHAGPVEFLYYWLHRALHHHYLYSRYHSHHHSSIVTEPITSVAHPFAEHLAYFTLFAIPMLTTLFIHKSSVAALYGYIFYIDFMNNMGHCNFEFFPKKLLSFFPLLKYLSYTPSSHSLHHTKFRSNYSLFMPIYDYIFGTVDKSTNTTYEASLKRPKESPDVVHLTQLTTLDSIYQLRLGFSSLASNPQTSKWYLNLMWPFTMFYMLMTWISRSAFVLESNTFHDLKLQCWLIPRFNTQYFSKRQNQTMNNLIEETIMEAELNGAKVISLGLLNQKQQLSSHFKLYIRRFPQLKIKVVDGTSLAAAIVLNNIPKGTNQVLLRGKFNKTAFVIANALCKKNIQVVVLYKDEFKELEQRVVIKGKLALSPINIPKIWLVGDEWDEYEQMQASKGSLFIPFSHFPPKKMRECCFYHYTPAMITPTTFVNSHSCENWLPRRVMSAWRIAGIIHALEGWNEHECGDTILNYEKVWKASICHGFQPLKILTN